jgi:hypothetical protein
LKKKHAQHNESASNFLFKSKQFNDWVVTTAFYSALHYVQNEIFPLTEGAKTFSNIDSYFAYCKPLRKTGCNRHSLTLDLVKKYIPPAYVFYKRLYDSCMNARYGSYIVSFPKAKISTEDLADIKKHLKK